MFFVSILCAAAAIALIVLDALFIGNIDKCFFSTVVCDELKSSYSQLFSQPLGRKVQVLKVQIACAALMLTTALLYMLLFISKSMAVRRSNRRILIENYQMPTQLVREIHRYSPTSQTWKPVSGPVNYDPRLFDCPHCGALVRLTQKRQ